MRNYADIDDLKIAMGDTWDATQEAYAEKLLAVASAGLRQIFKSHFLNLEERISSGELEEVIVNQVIVDMVVRNLAGSATPLSGDFSQFSQAAGGYSISVSSSGSNLYLKKEHARWLGLPSITTSQINFY